MLPDVLSDPFGERREGLPSRLMTLMGGRIEFLGDNARLLELVDAAYGRLPAHSLPGMPPLRVRLIESPARVGRSRNRFLPARLVAGGGLVGALAAGGSVVLVSPQTRSAVVALSPGVLRSPYHARYEWLELAVYTLTCRARGLVPLHAACVSLGGKALLLLGESGAGKSTVSLLSVRAGLDFVAEDSVLLAPRSLRATGVASFLHVRSDSLGWLPREEAAVIRGSPVIRRKSGVRKFEVDLRRRPFGLAASPPRIVGTVFLSREAARTGRRLRALRPADLGRRLRITQRYAATQPAWEGFEERMRRLPAHVLCRGEHPMESVETLRGLLADGR